MIRGSEMSKDKAEGKTCPLAEELCKRDPDNRDTVYIKGCPVFDPDCTPPSHDLREKVVEAARAIRKAVEGNAAPIEVEHALEIMDGCKLSAKLLLDLFAALDAAVPDGGKG